MLLLGSELQYTCCCSSHQLDPSHEGQASPLTDPNTFRIILLQYSCLQETKVAQQDSH